MESKLKFKVGDKVRVKSLEWYYEHKGVFGDIINDYDYVFLNEMAKFCGEILEITEIKRDYYRTEGNKYCWMDWMLEDKAVTEEKQEVEQLNKNNMETKKMTLKEAQEFVKNTKYLVFTEEQSLVLQTKLFEIGCKWHISGANLCHTEEPFLFIDDNLVIRCSTKSFYREFEKSEKRYVETDNVISIEILQPKPKFDPNTLKTFDKVLVKEIGTEWRARYFEMYRDEYFRTTNGASWRICIPYNDDTKHLLGTSKDAPEFYKLD